MGYIIIIIGALSVIFAMYQLGGWSERLEDKNDIQNLTDVNKGVYRDKKGCYRRKK